MPTVAAGARLLAATLQRQPVVADRQLHVVGLHPGKIGADDDLAVALTDVDARLPCRQFACGVEIGAKKPADEPIQLAMEVSSGSRSQGPRAGVVNG